jgi:rubrerythrin
MVDPMDERERYTFSSLISSLIGMERRVKEFYQVTAVATERPDLKSLFGEFADNNSRRMEMMRKTRTESVVEMTLEPIAGLKLAEPLAEIDSAIRDERIADIEKLANLERTVSDVYTRASAKIRTMSAETSQLLETLARQSIERVNELDRFRS